MEILILNYEFPPVGGGGGRASEELARGFVEAGHEVDVVTSNAPGLPKKEERECIDIYRVDVSRRDLNSASIRSMLLYPISGFPTAARLCRENDYDFINTHFAVPTGPLGVAVSKLFGIPNLLSIHGGDIYSPTKSISPHRSTLMSYTVHNIMKSADRVVAQSTEIRSRARKHHRVERGIDRVPLPYRSFGSPEEDEDGFGDLEGGKKYVVSVGRLVERKDYRSLIEALSSVGEEIEAIIIGEGPLREDLEDKAQEEGLRDRVHFTGEVSEEEKFKYLREADLYVLSSLHEGFGICLQEAMDAELPIVATDNGGHTDFIEDGENGYLVPTGDVEELARKIEKAMSEDTTEMVERNQEKLEEFKPERICRRYIEIAREIQ